MADEHKRPLLMVDIDGVISLFGGWQAGGGWQTEGGWQARSSPAEAPAIAGSLHSIDGTLHYLSSTAAAHLLTLACVFDLVWASGWEERAEEHLPHLLGLPAGLPFLRFSRMTGSPPARSHAHWKLEAIDAYAGERPLAWIDDALDGACQRWAQARAAPTLLVRTKPEHGLTEREVGVLSGWARSLAPAAATPR